MTEGSYYDKSLTYLVRVTVEVWEVCYAGDLEKSYVNDQAVVGEVALLLHH